MSEKKQVPMIVIWIMVGLILLLGYHLSSKPKRPTTYAGFETNKPFFKKGKHQLSQFWLDSDTLDAAEKELIERMQDKGWQLGNIQQEKLDAYRSEIGMAYFFQRDQGHCIVHLNDTDKGFLAVQMTVPRLDGPLEEGPRKKRKGD